MYDFTTTPNSITLNQSTNKAFKSSNEKAWPKHTRTLKMSKAWCPNLAPVWPVGAVGDKEDAEFTLGRLNHCVSLEEDIEQKPRNTSFS